jgi:protein-disulfide isomerase
MLAADQSVELVLVHHPILSSASVDAAGLQQAVFLHHGAERAYDVHLAVMASRGPANGARVRSICREMGLDGFSDGELVLAAAQVASMTKGAIALGLKFTPSFILADTAFIGWPGRGTLDAMIAAKRQCGQVQCA